MGRLLIQLQALQLALLMALQLAQLWALQLAMLLAATPLLLRHLLLVKAFHAAPGRACLQWHPHWSRSLSSLPLAEQALV